MFLRCQGPIWEFDDFSPCFRRDFLQTLFPLAACGASLLLILAQTIRRTIQTYHKRGKRGYSSLNGSSSSSTDVDSTGEEGAEHDHLTLHKTMSKASDIEEEISRPTGAAFVAIAELLFVAGEVAINSTSLALHSRGHRGSVAAIASLAAWAYVFLLVSLRLLPSIANRGSLPKLWGHTATLYLLQWAFTTMLFRSALLHPRSYLSEALTIANFTLASLLVLIAITTRRGNRAVVLLHEGKLEPSHEPLASLLSLATFGWVDAIVWQGYKKTLEIEDVWNLLPQDKAAVLLVNFRQLGSTIRLAWRLVIFFRRDLLLQQAWQLIGSLFMFAPTFLLKAILEYMETPDDTPASTAWLYVILLIVTGCVTAISDGQALWIGRKICIRLRAVIVGEIYRKTLLRRAASTTDTDMASDERTASDGPEKKPGLKRRVTSLFQKKAAKDSSQPPRKKASDDSRVNSGTIINLMSVDALKVSEISAYLHLLIPSVPVQLTVAILFLYRLMGWSAIGGVVVMVASMPLNAYFAKLFGKVHTMITSGTDARMEQTNEVLQNIRIIKYFAWEQRYSQFINEKRAVEVKALRYRFMAWIGASMVWYAVPLLITFVSFWLYTVIEEKDLVPSVAFPALSLFQLLRFPLDRLAEMTARIAEAAVSCSRVDRFLNEEETSKYQQLHEDGSNGRETEIGFDRATFSWGPKDEDLGQENPAFRLISMDIRFKVGALNIIAGPSGSGKTSLLMALLGEMTLIDGQVHLPGGQSREDLKADPQTGLIDSVAYCAQQAWLVNDTIQQNIIFASPWDERRYNSVLEACALKKDIEILADGDATLVGEKGIVVSGGQKQRISLARALYSNARHVLLDDCLSAVDSHTAQHIFEHCVLGPLMLNRTCILVTHNVGLCVPRSQFVVVLANGKISSQGEPEKIMQSGALGEELSMSRSATEVHSRLQSIHDVKTADPRGNNEPTAGSTESTEELSTTSKAQAGENANRRTEEKAVGAVSWKVMRLYLTSMGPWYFWFLVLFFFAAENIAGVWTNVWVRAFANSYLHRSASISGISARSQATNHLPAVTNGYRPDLSWTGPALWRHFPLALDQEFSIQNANVNAGYYLSIFAVLALLFLSIVTARNAVLFTGSLNASRAIHAGLLNSVMRAKFKFFDSTPLGQIMNRFSKDLQAIDQDVAPTAAGCLQGIFAMVAIIVLISVITPGFIIAMIFLSVIYAAIGLFYVQCSRDLKRLESVQRSPVYQLFGETLSGITTIRAYGDSRRFARENFHRVDTHNRPFIYLWSANRWLALRVDFAGALVSFFAGALVVAGARTLDAGAAGLSMTYALMFNENILWLVRLYADNEQNMNHVERVKTFLDVEQEADALIPATQPAGNWPDKGAVEFVDYSTRYRADLEPVLKNLNVKFHGEEKVGIVGRTGAGKSSLALALFRGLEADQGKILIDGVDIGTIGLQTLRENITIVPQDPTLFTGTIRNNLDPFGLFTDEEIFTALRRVHLIGSSPGSSTPASVPAEPVNTLIAPTRPDDTDPAADLANVVTNIRENANIFLTLSSPITESGSNLSQGQRQLLCLARAILKQPRVLLMDEATASIDYATDARIQETLRQIAGSTIITIAHRLQTIVDYDKVLVLDRGEIVEYDAPWVLIRKTGGVFRGMCEMSGDLEGLLEAAGKAEKARMLIEV